MDSTQFTYTQNKSASFQSSVDVIDVEFTVREETVN